MLLEICVLSLYIFFYVCTLIPDVVCAGARRRSKRVLPYSHRDIHLVLLSHLTASISRPLDTEINHTPTQLRESAHRVNHHMVECQKGVP